jgi:ectoine hydroxylase-related dioxygenase (phytanoyl-CoA dioxygenase family)
MDYEPKMKKIEYDTVKFDFQKRLKNLFSIGDLSSINDNVAVFKRENDQNTSYHKLYYEWIRRDNIIQLYDEFIHLVIRPLYNEKIIYQAIPTFRICYPNNIAVGEFHKDKYYRDIKWAEQVNEMNYYLPITDAYDTNTIWVESIEDKGDYAPIECKYGTVVQWDGSNLSHGNKLNKTGKCRVSVDFRVIKESKYIDSNCETINTKMKFGLGGYYKKTKL